MVPKLVFAALALWLSALEILGQKTDAGCSGLDTFIITVDYATTPKSLSLRAVSSLGECLAICKAAKDCQATNFYSVRSSTSPICELLASKQVDGLGVDGNATSSVFKMYYAERICLPVDRHVCNSRTWAFEKVPQTVLQDIKSLSSTILDTRKNLSAQECLTQCLRTESCEAALVKRAGSPTGLTDCQLISMNRHTVRNPDHYFKSSNSFDMYESNCRNDTALDLDQARAGCSFSSEVLHRRSSIKLYDQRMNGIQNSDECQSLCINFGQAPCRLYTFDRRQNSCYLSHSRSEADPTVDGGSRVFLDETAASDVTSSELDDCVQFDLACTPSALTVNVSTSRMFRGTFGILRSDKPDCRMTVDNEQRFQLTLSYADCDIKKEKSGLYSTIVSLKYGSSQLFTYKDRQVKLVCRQVAMHLDEIAVTTHLNIKNFTTHGPSVIAAPKPIPIGLGDFELKMLDLTLQPVAKVRPGQDGYLEVSQVGPYRLSELLAPPDIAITNLVASNMDGREEVTLLDELGCPVQRDLVKPFEPVDGARTWRARIRYFAFNDTSNKVHFSGLVKPCPGACPSPDAKCKGTEKKEKPFPVRLRRDSEHQPISVNAIGEVVIIDPHPVQEADVEANIVDP